MVRLVGISEVLTIPLPPMRTSGLPLSEASDGETPPLASAFYYFVSGTTVCGEGTIGYKSSGEPRPMALPCP